MYKLEFWLTVILIFTLLLSGCAAPATPADEGPDAVEITLSGLSEPAAISVGELKRLPPAAGTAESINSLGEVKDVPYKGAELGDILAKYDLERETLTGLRLVSGDGYGIEIPAAVIQNREIVFAYELYGEPLKEDSLPIRAVVPGERAMYWAKNLVEVVFVRDEPVAPVTNIVFLEDSLAELPVLTYEYGGEADKAVGLAAMLGLTEDAKVVLLGRDGLVKNEMLELARYAYAIKFTGDGAPLFIAPDLPLGMQVKELGAVVYNGTATVFATGLADARGILAGEAITGLLGEYLAAEVAVAGKTLAPAALAEQEFSVSAAGVALRP